jgi:hypothetical protein
MKFNSDLKFGQIYEKEFIKIMGFKSYEHETTKAIKEHDNMILSLNTIVVKQNMKSKRID